MNKEEITCFTFLTPWGRFGAEASSRALTGLYFPDCIPDEFAAHAAHAPSSPLHTRIEREIVEYFKGKRHDFDLPVAPEGTPFMQSVWRELCAIPFGETRTYGALAKALGNPGAARAVGMACRKNPIPLVIPCHRVVGAGDKLVGFSGGGVGVKRKLLKLEGAGIFTR